MKLLPIIIILALLQLALASCSSSGSKEKSVKLWPAPGWTSNEVHHAESR